MAATATEAHSEKLISRAASATSCRTRLVFASIKSFTFSRAFSLRIPHDRLLSWSQTPDRVGLTPGK